MLNYTCSMESFDELRMLIVKGEEVWRLSDATETIAEVMLAAFNILQDTLLICPPIGF